MEEMKDELAEEYGADDVDISRNGFSLNWDTPDGDITENVHAMVDVLEDVTDDYPEYDYHTLVEDELYTVTAWYPEEDDE